MVPYPTEKIYQGKQIITEIHTWADPNRQENLLPLTHLVNVSDLFDNQSSIQEYVV
jgi:hypothetical protein